MPKFEHIHQAGEQLPKALKRFLKKYFSYNDLDKLEILGGSVVISLSTVRKGMKSQKRRQIDEDYVHRLKDTSSDISSLRKELISLTNKQLREICQQIGLPAGSKSPNHELVGNIEKRMLSTDRWNRIIDG